MSLTQDRFILPNTVKVSNYNLKVNTDLDNFVFTGNVIIDISVVASCSEIVMNSLGLVYTDDAVIQNKTNNTSEVISKSDLLCNDKDERLTLKLSKNVEIGNELQICLKYKGELTDNLKGFYRSNYVDENGNKKWLATTQCEPTDARRILPCWDEPELKATFDISMVISSEYDALSNMGEISKEELPDNKVLINFAKTPKMSSYLLAFVVGNFSYIEASYERHISKEPCRCRIYAFAGKEKEGQLALDTTVKSLMWYEEFFKIDYPLNKCDLIAIPDFPTMAMENWGLVTYREVALLCTESSSTSTKSLVTLVVAHELAHQWFGNLVTMQWWKELWLNESFATYLEYFVSDVLSPEWELWSDFVAQDYDSALTLDALVNSHPVEVDVSLAQEIDEIFDGISYAKGCALMRMCVTWIGFDAFKTAMQSYMEQHKYGNATTIDLWNALSKASGKPVKDIMNDWTAVQGYPFLSCSRPTPDTVIVKQQRFLAKDDPSAKNHLWILPMIISDAPDKVVLLPAEEEYKLSVDPKAPFIKLNMGQTALCRVLYDESMLSSIASSMKSGELPNMDIGGLLNDVAAFSSKGLISATSVLELAPAFNFSSDSSVISGMLGLFYDISHTVKSSSEASAKLDDYKISVYKPILNKIGLTHGESDSDRVKQSRGQIVGVLASCGEKTCLDFLTNCFKKYCNSGNDSDMPADYRSSGYGAIIKYGDEDTWNQMKSQYEKTTDASEKLRTLRALGCTKSPKLIDAALQYGISNEVKQQDSSYILNSVARRYGLTQYYDFIKSNYRNLFKKCEGAPSQLEHYCGALDAFSTRESAKDVEEWYNSLEAEYRTIERHISQSVETINISATYREREYNNIIDFLNKL